MLNAMPYYGGKLVMVREPEPYKTESGVERLGALPVVDPAHGQRARCSHTAQHVHNTCGIDDVFMSTGASQKKSP